MASVSLRCLPSLLAKFVCPRFLALMPRRFAVPLLTLALAAIAHAHDPYESWTAVALRPNALEINLTMAQSTALRLVDPEAKIRGLTEENFPAYRARFEQEAATLYILTAG